MSYAPINHPNLRRLKGHGDLLLKNADGILLCFTIAQVRLFCNFDTTLHHQKFDAEIVALPAAYEEFAHLWNAAEDVPYKFSTLDVGDNTIIHGEHPEADSIAPLAPSTARTPSRYTEEQEEDIEAMKWHIIRGHHLHRQRVEQSKAQAKAKRQRTEEEKRGRVVEGTWVEERDVGGRQRKRRVRSPSTEAGPSGTAWDSEMRPAKEQERDTTQEQEEDQEMQEEGDGTGMRKE